MSNKHVLNKISILQWNCRSLSTNQHYLQQYLKNHRHHVLVLQSLNIVKSKLPKIDNYFFPPVYNFCDKNKYIQHDLEYWPVFPSPVPAECTDVFPTTVRDKFNEHRITNIVFVYYPHGPNNTNTDWLRTLNMDNG